MGCVPPPENNLPVEITFGETRFLIPQEYFVPHLPSTLVPSQGMDKDVGVLLDIPLQDLGYPLERKMGYRYELTFLITPLKIHHSPTLPLSASHAWNGSDLYEDRVIEFDKLTHLYRVYDSTYRITWHFFKSFPTGLIVPKQEWVAACRIKYTKKEELSNLDYVTCKTFFLYKEVHIQMTFSGRYIKKIEEIKQKILQLFKNWEVSQLPYDSQVK